MVRRPICMGYGLILVTLVIAGVALGNNADSVNCQEVELMPKAYSQLLEKGYRELAEKLCEFQRLSGLFDWSRISEAVLRKFEQKYNISQDDMHTLTQVTEEQQKLINEQHRLDREQLVQVIRKKRNHGQKYRFLFAGVKHAGKTTTMRYLCEHRAQSMRGSKRICHESCEAKFPVVSGSDAYNNDQLAVEGTDVLERHDVFDEITMIDTVGFSNINRNNAVPYQLYADGYVMQDCQFKPEHLNHTAKVNLFKLADWGHVLLNMSFHKDNNCLLKKPDEDLRSHSIAIFYKQADEMQVPALKELVKELKKGHTHRGRELKGRDPVIVLTHLECEDQCTEQQVAQIETEFAVRLGLQPAFVKALPDAGMGECALVGYHANQTCNRIGSFIPPRAYAGLLQALEKRADNYLAAHK